MKVSELFSLDNKLTIYIFSLDLSYVLTQNENTFTEQFIGQIIVNQCIEWSD